RGAPIECAQEFEHIELTAPATPWSGGGYRVLLSIGKSSRSPSQFGAIARTHFTGGGYSGSVSTAVMILGLSNRSGQATEVVAELRRASVVAAFNTPVGIRRVDLAAGAWVPGGWTLLTQASMPAHDRVSGVALQESVCNVISAFAIIPALPLTASEWQMYAGVSGQAPNVIDFDPPWELAPGEGLYCYVQSLTTAVYGNFTWSEHDPEYAIQ
ncbi:hypothetical protein LCGC14_1835420, partial [marine sediment metagenome]